MGKRIPHLARKKNCTGCLACIDSCNHKALDKYIGKDGHYYVKVDWQSCIGCLKCERTCPIVSGFDYGYSEDAAFYAAWNLNNDERMSSASGGVFSAMAHYMLERGGAVIGAASEGVFDVRHKIVENLDELNNLQGTKYTQSDTRGVYVMTKELLSRGRTVLFSGTGCQIAGLLSFLGDYNINGQLITVDLICGGVPSKLLIEKFVEFEPYNVDKIVSYRTKDNGWRPKGFMYNLKVEDDKGVIHDYLGLPNLITTGFSKELTERYSCYNCQFVGTHRKSDFTIGDLWGDSDYPEQHYMGLSLLVAHSNKAQVLLEEMRDYLQTAPCDADSATKVNFRLIQGKNARQYTFERIFLTSLFSRCSYSTLKKIYADDHSSFCLWAIWSLVRKTYVKILKKMI